MKQLHLFCRICALVSFLAINYSKVLSVKLRFVMSKSIATKLKLHAVYQENISIKAIDSNKRSFVVHQDYGIRVKLFY